MKHSDDAQLAAISIAVQVAVQNVSAEVPLAAMRDALGMIAEFRSELRERKERHLAECHGGQS